MTDKFKNINGVLHKEICGEWVEVTGANHCVPFWQDALRGILLILFVLSFMVRV